MFTFQSRLAEKRTDGDWSPTVTNYETVSDAAVAARQFQDDCNDQGVQVNIRVCELLEGGDSKVVEGLIL